MKSLQLVVKNFPKHLLLLFCCAITLFVLLPVTDAVCTDTDTFWFSGAVMNSTYQTAQGVNVSVIQASQGTPIPENPKWALTDATGRFNITSINGSCSLLFQVSARLYHPDNRTGLEVGPTLPILPKEAIQQEMENGTIYLQPAATLQLNAINNSGNNLSFNYFILEKTFGMFVSEKITTLTNATNILVPRNRNYTVVFFRSPDAVGNCDIDPTACIPPLTYSLTNISSYEGTNYTLPITQNMTYASNYLTGFITVQGGRNDINVTSITAKLSVSGMVPPNAEVSLGTPNITNGINISNFTTNYSLQLMGNPTTGITYMLEFFGSNGTGSSATYYAAFQNITITQDTQFNLTLKPLAGTYTQTSDLNATQTTIRLIDEENSSVTDIHLEAQVAMSSGTFTYMYESVTQGNLTVPFLNESNVTLEIYSSNFAPLKKVINLTQNPITIQLKQFNPEGVNSSGSSEGKFSNFTFKLIKNEANCNGIQPNASCDVASFGTEFNPFKAMMGGKVNGRLQITDGPMVMFVGMDLLASGPPDAALNDQAESDLTNQSGGSFQQIWKVASFAPDIYDAILIGIPLNTSLVIPSSGINATLTYLYDSNWNIIWNASADPNLSNIPTEYADYNTSWFNASRGGMSCSLSCTATTSDFTCCVALTSNNFSGDYVWLKLPHFSGPGASINGNADNTPPTTAPALLSVNDSDADGNIELTWQNDTNESNEQYLILRYTTTINASTAASATLVKTITNETTTSYEDNTSVHATNYWYALVTKDTAGNYNLSVVSNSLNATTDDTFKPMSPTGLSIVDSGSGVAELAWTAVTRDVNNNTDATGIIYQIWRNTTANFSKALANETLAYLTNTTARSYNDNSVSVNTTYYYIVTAVDDAGNKNLSIGPTNNGSVSIATYCGDGTCQSGESSSSCSADCGSGNQDTGGGGGGGGNTQQNTTTSGTTTLNTSGEKKWDSVTAEQLAIWTIKDVDIEVTQLEFTLLENKTNVSVKIAKLSSAPTTLLPSERVVYQYVEVTPSNIEEGQLTNAKIRFKVNLSWLSEKNILENDVLLLRYANDVWNELPTNKTGSDTSYVYYEAETPGFSYFAISGKEQPKNESELQQEQQGDQGENNSQEEILLTPETTEDEKALPRVNWILWVILTAIIVILAIGIYFYRQQNLHKTAKRLEAESKDKEEEEKE
ncbi:PGF-pre-PGF domain-containing protein [Candidatus Woesearchaeota archaeon]|nr:PGF-pre-PGF domain-containing protein [Candidatus Woesearchaeota archaeon]